MDNGPGWPPKEQPAAGVSLREAQRTVRLFPGTFVSISWLTQSTGTGQFLSLSPFPLLKWTDNRHLLGLLW